jgi:hypothetical protein
VFWQFIRIQTGCQQKAKSMQIRIERKGDLAVMYLSGRIDIESSPQFARRTACSSAEATPRENNHR